MAVGNVMTPLCRLSYPNLFQTRKNELSGRDEYSAVLLFKKDEDLTDLYNAAQAVMVEKFGADQSQWPKQMHNPFRDQSELVIKDKATGNPILKDGKPQQLPGTEPGALFLNVKSTQKPGVVDASVKPIIEPKEIYAGCWVHASLRPFYYGDKKEHKGNKGISFGLQNVQKVKDDTPLGGVSRPEDDFKPIAGTKASASAAGSGNKPARNLFGGE